MNIKYVSLLSLFCAVAANATEPSIIEKFDQTKEKLADCDTRKMNQSVLSWLTEGCINCEKEKEEFETAFTELKKEFRTALANNDRETAQLLNTKINEAILNETAKLLAIARK